MQKHRTDQRERRKPDGRRDERTDDFRQIRGIFMKTAQDLGVFQVHRLTDSLRSTPYTTRFTRTNTREVSRLGVAKRAPRDRRRPLAVAVHVRWHEDPPQTRGDAVLEFEPMPPQKRKEQQRGDDDHEQDLVCVRESILAVARATIRNPGRELALGRAPPHPTPLPYPDVVRYCPRCGQWPRALGVRGAMVLFCLVRIRD